MRGPIIVAIWLASVLAPGLATAQDADTLRRELDQLRRQQEQYQKAIDALSDRLKRLESQPAPSAVAPTPSPAVVAQPAPGPTTAPPSPIDLARPRQPFALYGQRGAGQLLFDMGVVGDFVGNITQSNVDEADGGTSRGARTASSPARSS